VLLLFLMAMMTMALLLPIAGCAKQAAHSVSPARSSVLEAWVEHPPVPVQVEPCPAPTPAPQPATTPTPDPAADVSWGEPPSNPHCYEPFRAALVVAALGQVSERPETTAEANQPGVTVRPDGTVILGPGGHIRMSEAEGSGLDTTAGELAANWRTESPTAQAGELAASGGGLRHVMEATGVTSEPAAVLFVIGGLILAGGVAAFVLVNRKLGSAIAAAGAAVLLAAWLLSNPVVMFALCGVGLLAVVGAVLWYGRAARADALALSAVTASVKTAANGSATAIKESVKTAAGAKRPVVDKAITRALLRAGEKP